MASTFDQHRLDRHQDWIVRREGGVKLVEVRGSVQDATLESVNLIGAEFEDCVFTKIKFVKVDLNGATFRRCILLDCTFDDCMLQDALTPNCEFHRTSFNGCSLAGLICDQSRF